MRVDIVSDVICPWCLSASGGWKGPGAPPGTVDRHELAALPAQPRYAAEGVDRRAYLAAKFGGVRSCRADLRQCRRGGRHRRHSLRLRPHPPHAEHAGCPSADPLCYGAGQGRCRRRSAVRGLFHRGPRHRRPRDPRRDRRRSGARCQKRRPTGWPARRSSSEVLAEDRSARRLGINAVPCFIFEGQYAVSGAQEPEFFLPVFDLMRNGGASAA